MSRILLVDDEAVAREAIGAQLEKLGYTVITAASAEEARTAFSGNVLDMALVDIRLSVESGLDLLPAFKEQDPDCQIVLITAYASVETAAEAMRLGASDYLVKPVKPHDLMRAVKRCLEHKRVLEENRRLEEENRKYREHLEERVREQTAEVRESEGKLRYLNNRFEAITDTVTDVLYLIDTDTNLTWWNKHVEHITGLSPEALQNRPAAEFFIEDDWPKLKLAIERAFAKGEAEEELLLHTVNGPALHHFKGTVLRNVEGEIVGLTGVGRDITERKKAEEEIRKLSTAIEQSPAVVIITDAEGNIEYVNEAFAMLTGFSSKEVLGKNPNVLKSGENPPAVYDELWQTILSGRTWRGELCNKNKDGTLGWDDVSISPLKNKQEEITHFVGVQFDITNRKQAEEALNEQIQKLERFNKLAVGREMKMIELKEEINALLREAGRKEKYVIHRASELDDGKQGA